MVSIEKNHGFLYLAPFGAKQVLYCKLTAKQAQLLVVSRKKA
jgi:hypothetical protein